MSFEFGDVSPQLWYRTFIVIGFPHGGKKYLYIICKLILYLPCHTCKFLHVRCFQNIFNQGHFDVNTLFNFSFYIFPNKIKWVPLPNKLCPVFIKYLPSSYQNTFWNRFLTIQSPNFLLEDNKIHEQMYMLVQKSFIEHEVI